MLPKATLIATVTLALLAVAIPIAPERSFGESVGLTVNGVFNLEEAIRQAEAIRNKHRQNLLNLQRNKHRQDLAQRNNYTLIHSPDYTLPPSTLPSSNHTQAVSPKLEKAGKRRALETRVGAITIGTPPQKFHVQFDSKSLSPVTLPSTILCSLTLSSWIVRSLGTLFFLYEQEVQEQEQVLPYLLSH